MAWCPLRAREAVLAAATAGAACRDAGDESATPEGAAGLLSFKNTLRAVAEGRYGDAAEGMLDSLWARQTPRRAARMAAMMRAG